MRKIIQIQALRFMQKRSDQDPDSQETELIALCDDGTVWTRTSTYDESGWVKVSDIPQE